MGVPLAGDYDVAVARPIDSRMVWTGTFTNLNDVPNKFLGLTCYVTGDQNLYVYQGGTTWEKVVTNNVDSPTVIQNPVDNLFLIQPSYNGQVVYVDSSVNSVQAIIQNPHTIYPNGFNVAFVQIGAGPIIFNTPVTKPANFSVLQNRLGLSTTAGQYAVASILKISNTNIFVLYGDLV